VWRLQVVTAKKFDDITVTCGTTTFPLRLDQKKELSQWCKAGKWDAEWLMIIDGAPSHFVSSGGDVQPLALNV